MFLDHLFVHILTYALWCKHMIMIFCCCFLVYNLQKYASKNSIFISKFIIVRLHLKQFLLAIMYNHYKIIVNSCLAIDYWLTCDLIQSLTSLTWINLILTLNLETKGTLPSSIVYKFICIQSEFLCKSCQLSILPDFSFYKVNTNAHILPCMGYIGMCRCEGYGFQAVYSRIAGI